MKSKTSHLDTLPNFYKEKFKNLSTETFKAIMESREKALEYAKKGIKQQEPENFTEEYIIKVADGMQALARIILEERGILTKN